MITVTNIQVYNFENAIIGMRNPMNSWDKSDSILCKSKDFEDCTSNCDSCPRKDEEFNDDIFCIGKNDLDLMQRLIHAGSPHDKFMRQILCSMQITAPLYYWKEFDTYKVATVANSTSTMHKIHSKPVETDDFSFDLPVLPSEEDFIKIKNMQWEIGAFLEWLRERYIDTKDSISKDNPYWRTMIQTLPDGYNQMRMWTGNYATLREIYKWRKQHKLQEWRIFCDMLLDGSLFPYGKELIAYELD